MFGYPTQYELILEWKPNLSRQGATYQWPKLTINLPILFSKYNAYKGKKSNTIKNRTR